MADVVEDNEDSSAPAVPPPVDGAASEGGEVRSARLEAMVAKRKTNFSYLQRAHVSSSHQASVFWLNCVRIKEAALQEYITSIPAERTLSFYYLALSLGKLAVQKPSCGIERSMLQLWEEFEYHFANSASKFLKYNTSRNADCFVPELGACSESGNVGLCRFSSEIVYSELQTPHLSFPLSYVEVLQSLLSSLEQVYNRFVEEESWATTAGYEAVIKVDAKVKHFVINPIARELTQLSIKELQVSVASELREKGGAR
jgi:hypothetical protein